MIFQRTEYVEETFDNVRHLTKALFTLLLEQGKISEQDLCQYFEKEEKNALINHEKLSPTIEMNCGKCGRKAFVRLDRESKCMFCGNRLDPHEHRTDTESTDKNSPDSLFSCQINETDIAKQSFFVGTSSKDNSADFLRDEVERHRQGYQYRPGSIGPSNIASAISETGNIATNFVVSAVALGVTTVIVNNRASGIPVDPKQDYLNRMSRKIERLCKSMKILRNISTSERPDKEEEFINIFTKVNRAKTERTTPGEGAIVTCPHCQTSNLRSDLFYLSCKSCNKEIALPIQPGFGVYYPSHEEPVGEPVYRQRKKEYIYTLFEAVFNYVSDTFGYTWDDLTRIVQRDFDKCTEKKENEPRVCAHCNRPIPENSQIGNRCVYCGKPNGESAFERFL